MHSSQNKLLQHGVSTAFVYISRQIGQSQRSSDRLEAEKFENLAGLFLTELFEVIDLASAISS
jgi:hypothetical protein